ncbi:hypothetical protein PCC6912_50640 [Chlorogloeopsis fritschii PCC 6912]|uniref:SPOR domain-containing protein n=1 Tax=Chlorogloeopsis fritschii PCC 6912 TaxID=211165 RepID=A0A433N1L6_CHLFR|nr:hypothetical protein [Chlorogloeopsis fritschii]RUR74886.1 hypothetical protein PCC6912_50640 [Chlorogloeopsis fritschii PCC 6912]
MKELVGANTVKYRVYHWWQGDDWSDPQWVHSGDFSELKAKEKVVQLKSTGFKLVKVVRIDSEEVAIA